jgi:hypothetical protein
MGTVKYSGPIASFHCPTEATIRSLKVHFSPKQLGEGTPSPDNVREIVGWDGVEVCKAGKNLAEKMFGYNSNGGNSTTTTITTDTTRNVVSSLISVKAGLKYLMSYSGTGSQSRYFWFDRYPIGTGAISIGGQYSVKNVIATAPENAKYMFIVWTRAELTETVGEVQVEQVGEATVSTAYEPYCGETVDYEFGVLGKNKFDKNTVTDYLRINGSGELTAQSGMSVSDYIEVIPNQTYTITTTGDISGNKRHAYYDINKEYLGVFPSHSTTITIPKNARYIRLTLYNDALDTTQVELGFSATAYEPFDSNHTIYGGLVDLISGEVTEEGINNYPYRVIILNGTEDWTLVKQNEQTTIFKYYYGLGAHNEGYSICSHFRRVLSSYNTLGISNSFVHGMSGNLFIQTDNALASTIENFKQYLSTQSQNNTPVIILFQAKGECESYSLASIFLKTFLSTNNVWSNADYVEVEYDLHETQDILTRKQFIVANQPHVATAPSSSLVTFSTDVKAPLKDCKIHFSPVQEGTGTPSPDNVRPIAGWTGIKVVATGKNLVRFAEQLTATENIQGSSKWLLDGFWKIPDRSKTYMYSAYIDNREGDSVANVAIWYRNETNTAYAGVISGSHIAAGEEGWSTLSVQAGATRYYAGFGLIMKKGAIASMGMVEIGDTRTEYEPYGQTIDLDWTDSVGTIYGGYVDLVTGEVVREAIKVTTNEIVSFHHITDRGNGVYEICLNIPIYARSERRMEAKCSCFVYGDTDTGVADHFTLTYVLNQKARQIRISHYFEEAPTVDVYKEYLRSIGFEVVYYIDPEKYTIDPQTLKSLLGTNNIWSTACDNIDVSYWTH